MKTLRFIGMALFAIVLSVNFAACSEEKDDDDDFVALLTSAAWRNSGDNDVFTFSEDGTGFIYECLEDYRNGLEEGSSLKWTYANGVMTVEHYYDGDVSDYGYTEVWTVLSSSKTQIVFDVYSEDEDDPEYDYVWTLTRIN